MGNSTTGIAKTHTKEKQFNLLLEGARCGSGEDLGRLLNLFRNYLMVMAEAKLDSAVRPKVGASDLVQETLLEAQKDFGRFRGKTTEELRGWLKQILLNNLLNQYRAWRQTQKRDLGREVFLTQAGLHESHVATASGASPSEIVSAREEQDRLHAALDRLPEHYRDVIVLRHREGCSFEEIGRRMNRTSDAARMLWYRAFERLGSELQAS